MAKSKNVVITGGARGVGRVLARGLTLQGHRLFLIDVDAEEVEYCARTHIPSVVAKAPSSQGLDANPGFCVCDLRDAEAVRAAVKAAAEHFGGRIHVLINNAGIARAQFSGGRTMEDPGVLDEWNAYIQTNLTGPFLVSQAAIPYMKRHDEGFDAEVNVGALSPEVTALAEGKTILSPEEISDGGCIINISSFRARQSQANCEGYSASKAGLLGLNHAMSISLAPWGIRANAVLPGYIEVQHETRKGDEANQPWASDVDHARHRSHPVGRVGRGEDITHAVQWLMGANFVNGEELVIDGGVSKIKYADA